MRSILVVLVTCLWPACCLASAGLDVTVLYDNYVFQEGLEADWGFACLIKGLDKTILFDTGTKSNILLDNAAKLDVDFNDVDVVVISHDHGDHYGGLDAFLQINSDVDVYLLEAFSSARTRTVQRRGARTVIVREPLEICKGARLTGPLGTQIKEQAIVLDTADGLVVITGCAHPGIVSMVKKSQEMIDKKIHMVFGGFHLHSASREAVQGIIQDFKDLGVQRAGPTHCTGDIAIEMFHQAYGKDFLQMGVGRRIALAPLPETPPVSK